MAPPICKISRPFFALVAAAGIALAGSALLATSASADENACPKLTQAKYPFLTCEPNAYGGVTLRMPGYKAPLECHQRMPDGECAASPQPWQYPIPRYGPAE